MEKYKIGDKVSYEDDRECYVAVISSGGRVETIERGFGGWEANHLPVVKRNFYWNVTGRDIKLIKSNNQEVIMNNTTKVAPVSEMAKKFLDEDTIALMEAGYLDNKMELTSEGIRVRDEITFDLVQKKLIEAAKAKIEEINGINEEEE